MTAALFFIVGLVLLYFGGEYLVKGSSSLATRLKLSPLFIGLTVVSFGTSAPELAVSLKAASAGSPDIALGNVIGSNICNIALILGLCALICPMVVKRQLVSIDAPFMIALSVGLFLFMRDGSLTRLDGFVFVVLLLGYIAFSYFHGKKQHIPDDELEGIPEKPAGIPLSIIQVLAGLTMLVFGGRFLVDAAVSTATTLGVPEAIIGLTIVAIGTSLPELVTSIIAAIRKHADIAIGNIVGSNIFNILGILGITASITPLQSQNITGMDWGFMLGTAIFMLVFLRTGFVLKRWEGALLFLGYVAYCSLLILNLA